MQMHVSRRARKHQLHANLAPRFTAMRATGPENHLTSRLGLLNICPCQPLLNM